jgi:hypothetical protein
MANVAWKMKEGRMWNLRFSTSWWVDEWGDGTGEMDGPKGGMDPEVGTDPEWEWGGADPNTPSGVSQRPASKENRMVFIVLCMGTGIAAGTIVIALAIVSVGVQSGLQRRGWLRWHWQCQLQGRKSFEKQEKVLMHNIMG